MSRWWRWRKTENRSADYSELMSAQHLADAGGSNPNPREGSAALLAGDWLGRALSAVELSPLGDAAPFAPCRFAKGWPGASAVWQKSVFATKSEMDTLPSDSGNPNLRNPGNVVIFGRNRRSNRPGNRGGYFKSQIFGRSLSTGPRTLACRYRHRQICRFTGSQNVG